MTYTLGQLLEQLGFRSRIYDLGRHIRELPADTFARVEALAAPYPAPYLQQAWLGLLLWARDSDDQHLLWFIRLPLDEQGLLVPAERDLFLQQLLVALGNNLEAAQQGQQLAAVLEGNPYVFQPSPERQAALHARINQSLQRPPSSHYAAACDYLQGDLAHWQELGLQGLADLAVRWQTHRQALIAAVARMPPEPLTRLCQCLENEIIDEALGRALQQRLQRELNADRADTHLLAALVRGLSQCRALALKQAALSALLADPASEDMEVLAAIASRCSLDLSSEALGLAFLERLCAQGQTAFDRLLADLLFNPALRPHLLAALRHPQRSARLAAASTGLAANSSRGTGAST